MDHERVIAEETNRVIDAVLSAAPQAPVPTCPDWSADDLLWHLTTVHAFWAEILASGALTDADMDGVEGRALQRPTERAAVVELLTEQTERLVAELRSRADEQPAWSWFGSDQTVGFTRRMQVHEAVMHRIDAELVAGRPVTPIDPEVAEAGILHAIDVMYAWWGTQPGFEFMPADTTVALTLTDRARTILLRPGRWRGVGQSGTSYDEPGVARITDLPPDAGFAGTAEQLDRWLWGRGEEPESDGDQQALDAVRAVVATGIQ